MTECLLCGSANLELVDLKDRAYNNCKNCSFIFIDLKSRISIDEEIIRYNNHDICTNDDKSVSFVKNILDKGLTYIKGTDVLDYGSGKCFIVNHILNGSKYSVSSYDPIYNNIKLNKSFDLIVASEVIEHFRYPIPEFSKLISYLKDGGVLAISSSLYTSSIDFSSWYYKTDPTHFSIYSQSSINFIADYFNLELLHFELPNIVVLKKI